MMSKSKSAIGCFFAVALGAAILAPAARAEYRCDAPRSDIEFTACKKAQEGPDALRHYIQRMRVIENLYFYDFVNEERLLAWRELERKNEPSPHEQQARVAE